MAPGLSCCFDGSPVIPTTHFHHQLFSALTRTSRANFKKGKGYQSDWESQGHRSGPPLPHLPATKQTFSARPVRAGLNRKGPVGFPPDLIRAKEPRQEDDRASFVVSRGLGKTQAPKGLKGFEGTPAGFERNGTFS